MSQSYQNLPISGPFTTQNKAVWGPHVLGEEPQILDGPLQV